MNYIPTFVFVLICTLFASIVASGQSDCKVDFIISPLDWEAPGFEFGMHTVNDEGKIWNDFNPGDTRSNLHLLDAYTEGIVEYVFTVYRGDEVVDLYVITYVENGKGCLNKFIPNRNTGSLTSLEIALTR
jgi:hypothetical protein